MIVYKCISKRLHQRFSLRIFLPRIVENLNLLQFVVCVCHLWTDFNEELLLYVRMSEIHSEGMTCPAGKNQDSIPGLPGEGKQCTPLDYCGHLWRVVSIAYYYSDPYSTIIENYRKLNTFESGFEWTAHPFIGKISQHSPQIGGGARLKVALAVTKRQLYNLYIIALLRCSES